MHGTKEFTWNNLLETTSTSTLCLALQLDLDVKALFKENKNRLKVLSVIYREVKRRLETKELYRVEYKNGGVVQLLYFYTQEEWQAKVAKEKQAEQQRQEQERAWEERERAREERERAWQAQQEQWEREAKEREEYWAEYERQQKERQQQRQTFFAKYFGVTPGETTWFKGCNHELRALKQRRNALAKKHHPDLATGNIDIMTAINNEFDLLVKNLDMAVA